MRVRCITTTIIYPDDSLKKSGWWHAEKYLTIGKEYEVYAIHTSWLNGIACYLVCDDNYNDMDYNYPIYIPTCYFEIVNNLKPSIWISPHNNPDYEGPIELSPEKYESIVDGNPNSIASFRRIKFLLEGKDIL